MMSSGWPAERRHWWSRAGMFCLTVPAVLLMVGCGGDKLVPVTGKVIHKGEPVKGGTVVFSPVAAGQEEPGKPATAPIQPDGTYTLGTNNPGDGAIAGKHAVRFTPPTVELTDKQRTDPKFTAPPPPYMGLSPKQAEVEVTAGANNIDIELVPGRR